MKKVTIKLPAIMMTPVYLRMEMAVSMRSLESMKGMEYLFLKRYCSPK